MNSKKLMWVMLAVLIGFAIFNVVSSFMGNQKNYNVVSYTDTYTFSRDVQTKIETKAKLAFDKTEDMEKAIEQFNQQSQQEQANAHAELLTKYSEGMAEPVKLVDYTSGLETLDGFLNIQNTVIVTGLSTNTGNEWVTGFGKNQLQLKDNSRLVFVFPEDAKIMNADPMPDETNGNVLTWFNRDQMNFPVVSYQ